MKYYTENMPVCGERNSVIGNETFFKTQEEHTSDFGIKRYDGEHQRTDTALKAKCH